MYGKQSKHCHWRISTRGDILTETTMEDIQLTTFWVIEHWSLRKISEFFLIFHKNFTHEVFDVIKTTARLKVLKSLLYMMECRLSFLWKPYFCGLVTLMVAHNHYCWHFSECSARQVFDSKNNRNDKIIGKLPAESNQSIETQMAET